MSDQAMTPPTLMSDVGIPHQIEESTGTGPVLSSPATTDQSQSQPVKRPRGRPKKARPDPTGEQPQALAKPPKKPEMVYADAPGDWNKAERIKDRISKALFLRISEPGITHAEIARRLGVHVSTIDRDFARAVKEGWLHFDNSIDRIRYEIVPQVIDNLSDFLKAKDRTVTLETAKGTVFKTYQAAEGLSDSNQTMLAIKIDMQPTEQPKLISGAIVGKPKE